MNPEERNAKVAAFKRKQLARETRKDCAELVYCYPLLSLDEALEMPQGDRKLLLTYARLRRTEDQLAQLTAFATAQSERRVLSKTVRDLKGAIKELEQAI
jgi:hypothetical protein